MQFQAQMGHFCNTQQAGHTLALILKSEASMCAVPTCTGAKKLVKRQGRLSHAGPEVFTGSEEMVCIRSDALQRAANMLTAAALPPHLPSTVISSRMWAQATPLFHSGPFVDSSQGKQSRKLNKIHHAAFCWFGSVSTTVKRFALSRPSPTGL